jgi:hypothetical protein
LTSIVHSPLDSPLYFGASGPEGNETAVHTEDVLAFSAEHYDHWAAALGATLSEWA